jgi:aquaporin Z
MRNAVVEFIGTFFLVLTAGSAVLAASPGVIGPLAVGAGLMVMIYAGGHISGAHYNPAVSLGVLLRGRLSAAELAPYWIAQVAGASVAAGVVIFLRGSAPAPTITQPGPAFVAELAFTFALVYVVLNVATAKRTSGNSYFGLAIGFTVLAGAFAVGSISGALFNPAVAVAAVIVGLLPAHMIWLYVIAELLGGTLAAFVFRFLNPEDL